MEDNFHHFKTIEEKKSTKFSVEKDQSKYMGILQSKSFLDKNLNLDQEEKNSNIFLTKKSNTNNTTNIFLINSIKENIQYENKNSLSDKNIEINNFNNILEENQRDNNSKENDNSDIPNNEYNSGRWSNEEHEKFIEGILKYGNEWKKVQSIIKTRSSTQARSHAQKFFLRMKKEIDPKILSDKNSLIQFIINNNNNLKNFCNLTHEQKERIYSVICSNLKTEEIQNKSNKETINNNWSNKEEEFGLDNLIDEDDNLAYNKNNIFNNPLDMKEKDEKRKNIFCSKKRKNSLDYILNINNNKIFNIKKDISHRKSMDISKIDNNFVNCLSSKNKQVEKKFNNELKNYSHIDNFNNYIINNSINNTNFNNRDNDVNKFQNFNSFNNFNNMNNTNFIIQNNYYNIINNFDNIKNNSNNINISINNNPNYYLNYDSFNSDLNNHINKDNNNKNASDLLYIEKKNSKNILENYTFLNNENFFPQLNINNHSENYYKTYENIEQNDPFNLKFENVNINNDYIIINENMCLYPNLTNLDERQIEDYELNLEEKNNINNLTYDD